MFIASFESAILEIKFALLNNEMAIGVLLFGLCSFLTGLPAWSVIIRCVIAFRDRRIIIISMRCGTVLGKWII